MAFGVEGVEDFLTGLRCSGADRSVGTLIAAKSTGRRILRPTVGFNVSLQGAEIDDEVVEPLFQLAFRPWNGLSAEARPGGQYLYPVNDQSCDFSSEDDLAGESVETDLSVRAVLAEVIVV